MQEILLRSKHKNHHIRLAVRQQFETHRQSSTFPVDWRLSAPATLGESQAKVNYREQPASAQCLLHAVAGVADVNIRARRIVFQHSYECMICMYACMCVYTGVFVCICLHLYVFILNNTILFTHICMYALSYYIRVNMYMFCYCYCRLFYVVCWHACCLAISMFGILKSTPI